MATAPPPSSEGLLQHTLESLQRQYAALDAEEKALESKIEKKKVDLERNEARLRSLQTVRPAFMEEYNKLEQELEKQYNSYVSRFRNVDYLEQELDRLRVAEQTKLALGERQLRRMQRRLQEEEQGDLRLLDGISGGVGEGEGVAGTKGEKRTKQQEPLLHLQKLRQQQQSAAFKNYGERARGTNSSNKIDVLGRAGTTRTSLIQQGGAAFGAAGGGGGAPGSRRHSTASSILEVGAKRRSSSSSVSSSSSRNKINRGQDVKGEGEGEGEVEEEEDDDADASLVEEEEGDDGEGQGDLLDTSDVEGLHPIQEDDF